MRIASASSGAASSPNRAAGTIPPSPYLGLLAEMRRLGIRAMVTLHHVTLPRWLAARGGWLARDVASLFARYAEEGIRRLGGSVDHWGTINEPASVAGAADVSAPLPPGPRS